MGKISEKKWEEVKKRFPRVKVRDRA